MGVMVTGGVGYLGSHACVALLEAGHDVVVLDDFSNSNRTMLDRVEALGGRVPCVEGSILDRDTLERAFALAPIDAVLHFAGRKSVAESVLEPELYAQVNVEGTSVLLDAMRRAGVPNLVFSSSCTVYGDGGGSMKGLDESTVISPISPYGESKVRAEKRISSAVERGDIRQATLLRYFNPVGAHPSARLGEEILAQSSNLLPRVIRARLTGEPLIVHGGDYPTRDGTCIRDYIHVEDVVRAHLDAVARSAELDPVERINLGSGVGTTVLELIDTVTRVSGGPVPYRIGPRRDGDAVALFALADRARERLGWEPRRSLEEACRHQWNWQRPQSDDDAGRLSSPAVPEEGINLRNHLIDGPDDSGSLSVSGGNPLLDGRSELDG